MHLMIKPFWFELWKLWAERDYRIPNTDWLVVCASYSSIFEILEYVIPAPAYGLCIAQCALHSVQAIPLYPKF